MRLSGCDLWTSRRRNKTAMNALTSGCNGLSQSDDDDTVCLVRYGEIALKSAPVRPPHRRTVIQCTWIWRGVTIYHRVSMVRKGYRPMSKIICHFFFLGVDLAVAITPKMRRVIRGSIQDEWQEYSWFVNLSFIPELGLLEIADEVMKSNISEYLHVFVLWNINLQGRNAPAGTRTRVKSSGGF